MLRSYMASVGETLLWKEVDGSGEDVCRRHNAVEERYKL